MTCTLSTALEADLPDVESEYTQEGTAVHELAANCLTTGASAIGWVGTELMGVVITEEMAESADDYANFVREVAGSLNGEIYTEQRVDFGNAIGAPGEFGTPDCYIISADGKTVAVIDRKFKWGKRVSAENNPQLMLYALGVRPEVEGFFGIPPTTYRFAIHQHLEGAASEWECTDAELLQFRAKAESAVRRAEQLKKDVGFGYPWRRLAGIYGAPSEGACRYCKAKATCYALAEKVLSGVVAGQPVDPTKVVDVADKLQRTVAGVSGVTNQTLGQWRALIPLVEQWCTAVSTRVADELNAGNAVPGWKLVQGRAGNRKWIDEAAVIQQFKSWRFKNEEIFETSLRSPAQLEKLVRADKRRSETLKSLYSQSEGKPIVAPESDKRPAVSVTPMFEPITDEEWL
jgi:hypothetical protein